MCIIYGLKCLHFEINVIGRHAWKPCKLIRLQVTYGCILPCQKWNQYFRGAFSRLLLAQRHLPLALVLRAPGQPDARPCATRSGASTRSTRSGLGSLRSTCLPPPSSQVGSSVMEARCPTTAVEHHSVLAPPMATSSDQDHSRRRLNLPTG